MTSEAQRQVILPLSKAIRIAWKNIRIRWWRSLLVTSGIILALAFLAYILASDTLLSSAAKNGSEQLRDRLLRDGVLSDLDDAQARTQTYWMVGLALMISFVGILNAMVMSVTERFREIGTMKCLGALDSFIIKLYLIESMFQGLVGTVIGMALGLMLAYGEALPMFGAETWTVVSLSSFSKIIGSCVLSGILLTICSALYPAWRAARMEPVDAMRTEV